MVIEYIRYKIETADAEAFEAAYKKASEALDASPFCKGYELAHGIEESENWILRIQWTSVAEHEQGFRSSPGFADFFQAVRPYFQQIQEMKHYEATKVMATK